MATKFALEALSNLFSDTDSRFELIAATLELAKLDTRESVESLATALECSRPESWPPPLNVGKHPGRKRAQAVKVSALLLLPLDCS